MDEIILAFAQQAGTGGGLPSLSNITVSRQSAGACRIGGGGGVLISASITVQWTSTNPDDTGYQLKIYENGVLVSTVANSVQFYAKTVSGNVEAGVPGETGSSQYTSNWTYRVDLVRLSDSVVLQSLTSDPWQHVYGVCA